MGSNTVNSSPTKNFFINMLTRDISLNDAILDLLDNCLDGALRSQNHISQNKNEKNYNSFVAKITITKDNFTISDNCGGISRELAENYAFRMGKQNYEQNHDATIGIYGIGMKRAIFKIGRSAIVSTKRGREAFSVTIPANWADTDNDWTFEIKDNDLSCLPYDGTTISINDLTSGVAIQWGDQDAIDYFVESLISEIKASYSLIIEKGFTIYVNDHKVKANPIQLLLSKDNGFKPYIFKKTYDDVNVNLIVGFYAPPPSDDDLDESVESKRSSADAGWTAHCERKLAESRDILFDEITGGNFNNIADDDKISLMHRYTLAAMNGTARLNLRLLAKAINSIAKGEQLRSPIYANEFNRYAQILETLSDEEIHLLAQLYKMRENDLKYIKLHNEPPKGINADYFTKLIAGYEYSQPEKVKEIKAIAGALLRTGLIYQENVGYGGSYVYALTPFFDKIIELVDFQDALDKENG